MSAQNLHILQIIEDFTRTLAQIFVRKRCLAQIFYGFCPQKLSANSEFWGRTRISCPHGRKIADFYGFSKDSTDFLKTPRINLGKNQKSVRVRVIFFTGQDAEQTRFSRTFR
jgi:hypothetical protein